MALPPGARLSAAPPSVGVVVLSWNGREDTLGALESLREVTYRPLAVVVVDNGSDDGTFEAVRAEHPEVDLVRSESNLGYAEGNNLGIRRALDLGSDYVLVLNNDVVVDPGFVTALVLEAERRPEAAALSSKVLYLDPPDLIWFAGATFDPRSGYNGRLRGYRRRDGREYSRVTETDRACGAAMLVSRRVLDEIGSFDADLFCYSEDLDWSLRARRAGYRLYVVPESRVWHKVSVASGGESSPTTLYYGARNTIEVCERHAPLGRIGTWRRRAIVLAAHLAQALRSAERRRGVGAVLQGWGDFRRRRFGERPGT